MTARNPPSVRSPRRVVAGLLRRLRAAPRRAHRLSRALADRAVVLLRQRVKRAAHWNRLRWRRPKPVRPILDVHVVRDLKIASPEVRSQDTTAVMAGVHDLLGSGPTSARPGATRLGLEDVRLTDDTEPRRLGRIDWSVDLRSGYRWPMQPWWQMRVGPVRGADIKVPWELGRLQHLPRLALFAVENHDEAAATAARADLIDFLDANPPGMGVQWACAMDVAIRAVNVVTAWDLLADDFPAPEPLRRRVVEAMVQHGDHIVRNLEWAPNGRGNHYLCNLVGLLTLGYWLPANAGRTGWFDFAAAALAHESGLQFDDEGANAEGSTSYHRLSTEVLIFAELLIRRAQRSGRIPRHIPWRERFTLGPAAKFASWSDSSESALHDTIVKAMAFVRATTLCDGRDVQIGDNDSGRLFHLLPPQDDDATATEAWFRCLSNNREADCAVHPAEAIGRAMASPTARPAPESRDVFTAFGFASLRNETFSIGFRTGTSGWATHGNHLHDDLLALVVVVDSVRFVVDPGTYVYTSLPERREEFRSAANHSTVQLGNRPQQDHSAVALFSATQRSEATIVRHEKNHLRATLTTPWGTVDREITLADDTLDITDVVQTTESWVIRLVLHPDVKVRTETIGTRLVRDGVEISLSGSWASVPAWYSPRYGVRVPTTMLELRPNRLLHRWSVHRIRPAPMTENQ